MQYFRTSQNVPPSNVLTDVPRAAGLDEDLRLVGAPYTNSVDGPEAMSAPPRLGQHSREILRDLGIDDNAIDNLVAEGIVVEAGY